MELVRALLTNTTDLAQWAHIPSACRSTPTTIFFSFQCCVGLYLHWVFTIRAGALAHGFILQNATFTRDWKWKLIWELQTETERHMMQIEPTTRPSYGIE
jgi:hypothetical protein